MSYLDKVLSLVGNSETTPFPGESQEKLPPVPRNSPAKEMFTAHRVDDIMRSLAHCRERLQAIKTVPPGQRQYHLLHVNNHLSNCLQQGKALSDNLQRNYPAEHKEMVALQKTVALARALSEDAKTATTAHLLQTVMYHLGHAKRHQEVMEGAKSAGKLWDFNCEHCETHVEGAAEHAEKLANHIRDNYPEEGKFLTSLQVPLEGSKLTPLSRVALTPQTPEASTVPKPIGRPNGPGLWHHKHWQLPPYIQHVAHALMRHGHGESDAIHMAVGIVKHWAEGHDGHGHKTHPDVRAAASANVAKWEELRGRAAASHAAKDAKGSKREHDLAATSWSDQAESALELVLAHVELAGGITSPPTRIYKSSMMNTKEKTFSAPGTKMIGPERQLFQVPSQTVAAGPPLPPGVELPSPKELRAFAAQIQKTLPDGDLRTSAIKHADVAAVKMEANQPIDALHALRTCQSDLVSGHRAFVATQMPAANVFVSSLVPAAASSARGEMYEGLDTRNKYRALTSQCAQFRDRIRRHYFHGMYNHMSEARFSRLDVVLAAQQVDLQSGMIYLEVPAELLPMGYPKDITYPNGNPVPPHVTVCFLGKITEDQFKVACERAKEAARALPALHGTIGGLGFFDPSTNSDGNMVAYAPVEIQGVFQLHNMLRDLRPPDAMPFRPHVTLEYLGPDDQPPPPVTANSLCFTQLYVCRGSDVRAYAFTGHHMKHPLGGRHQPQPRGQGERIAPLSRVLASIGR